MGIIVPFTGVTRSYENPPPPACGGEGRGGVCAPQSDPGDENDSPGRPAEPAATQAEDASNE
jgi:hypothetical protein